MESSITAFCRSLSAFCRHVESSSGSLSDSIQRRPIPLDSAASAFLQCLDRRVSAASADLDLLESMALGTVSFEELLGHCNEVYKINLKYISDLESRFAGFGYVPGIEAEDGEGGGEDSGVLSTYTSPANGIDRSHLGCGSVPAARPSRMRLDDDFLFEDSVSLRNLGFSDACLATLASEEAFWSTQRGQLNEEEKVNEKGDDCDATLKKFSELDMSDDEGRPHEKATDSQLLKDVPDPQGIATKAVIKASRDEYDSLPSYMKTLASWEELQEAVGKLNSYFCKDGTKGSDALNQDDTEKIGLGRKGRSYLLVLLRMNQLTMENIGGSIYYRIIC